MDSQCTSVCPLTSEEMIMAKRMLGSKAGTEVALLGVDANPLATTVSDVYAYAKAHGVDWPFLAGTKAQ
jgi:cytochrome oxidase Cu insertion factor (SCO1/SenC/PrrC family)